MRARWIVPVILVGILVCACLPLSLAWLGGRLRPTPVPGPAVMIMSPHYGDRVPMERVVLVQSEVRDTTYLVTQVELWVDGELQWVDGSPEPQGISRLYAVQGWQPSLPGPHTVIVRALNSKGAAGQAVVVVEAVEGLIAVGPQGEEQYVNDLTSVSYLASEGQTVEDIAESQGVSVEGILELNPDVHANESLEDGQLVEVPFDPDTWIEAEEKEEGADVGPQLGEAEGAEPPEPPIVVPDPPHQLGLPGEPVELRITNLTPSTLNPEPGEEIVIGMTIMNTGGTTAEDFYWAWDPGTGEGWIQDESPLASLAPGDDVVRDLTYAYDQAGQYRGRAWADSREQHDEDDEDDNFAYAIISVGVERPFAPVNPIPQNQLGDLIRLLERIRHGRGGRGGNGGEGSDLEQPPTEPSLAVSHEGCDVKVEWCPTSSNVSDFSLYRWDSMQGEVVEEFPAGPGCASWTDSVPRAEDYYFQLVARNEFGESVSDIVREQVPHDDCRSLGCDLVLLEIEAEGALVRGDVRETYDDVYCYAALDDLPEERFPPGQTEFFELDPNGMFAIENYLGGENTRLVTMPAEDRLRVFMECWGWAEGADEPEPLGEFTNFHNPDDWDGEPLYGDGAGFRVQYSINRVASATCMEVVEGPPDIPAPYNPHIAPALRTGLALEWTWAGNEDWIEGFWILCDGEKIQWVYTDDVDFRNEGAAPGATTYNEKLDELIGYPDCDGGCNLSVVAGFKDGPLASNPGFNSPPSEAFPHFGADCPAVVTVWFESLEFPYLRAYDGGPSVPTYGRQGVNFDHILRHTLEFGSDGPLMVEEGVEYTSRFYVSTGLDAEEELVVRTGFWEKPSGGFVYYAPEWLICDVWTSYSAMPPEWWARVDSEALHYLVGQGEAGSCRVTYTLHYGEPSD